MYQKLERLSRKKAKEASVSSEILSSIPEMISELVTKFGPEMYREWLEKPNRITEHYAGGILVITPVLENKWEAYWNLLPVSTLLEYLDSAPPSLVCFPEEARAALLDNRLDKEELAIFVSVKQSSKKIDTQIEDTFVAGVVFYARDGTFKDRPRACGEKD